MKIDVRYIAKLAKLRLDEDKIPMFESQMINILGMVENLPEIDNEALGADAANAMVLRPDDIGESLSRGEVLSNAPQSQAGCIVVPKTV